MQDSEKRSTARHRSQQNSSQPLEGEEEYRYGARRVLPAHGLRFALLAGVSGGIVALLIPVMIILINATLFQDAARLGASMSYQMALAITEWQCGGVFLDLVVAFATGYVVGKMAVQRRLGFYAGLLVGAIANIGNVLVHYIPGYPDNTTTKVTLSASGIAQGLLGIAVLVVIWALVGGLMSVWGSWTSTRRHPYYEKAELD